MSDDITKLLSASAADFLGAQRAASGVREDIARAPAFDRRLWREMAQLGWLGLGLPEALGGSELGLREAAVLCGEIGRAASPAPYIAASLMPSLLLAGCELNSFVCELAASLTSGERPFTIAWQEHSRQSDEAHPDATFGDGCISGVKRFVPAAEAAGVLLVSADHRGKLVVAAVAANARGVRLEPYAAGLDSEAIVHFDEAPALSAQPIAAGDDARRALKISLQAGRIALSAQLAGLAGGLLDKTLEYVGGRVQFGRPISSFQAIRHRCADLYIATRLASASWNYALRLFESDADSLATAAAISAAKARCGDVAVLVGREAVQMHGAMGFTEEGGVGVFLRAALHGRAWLGTPLAHRRRFMALQEHAAEVQYG